MAEKEVKNNNISTESKENSENKLDLSKFELKERKKMASFEIVKIASEKKTPGQEKLNMIKKEISKKYKLEKALTNIEILSYIGDYELTPNLQKIFTTKPVRTASGVAIVAIMSYPFACPHGKCATCPGGPDSNFGSVPQSYTGHEPATIRAIRNNYDAYLQVMNRLEQYVLLNQIPEKIELIIMGGTFPSYAKEYQTNFVKDAFKAMNDFSKEFFVDKKLQREKFNNFFELPGNIHDESRKDRINKKLSDLKNSTETTLEKEQLYNETTIARCVGMTLETRPDYAGLEIGNFILGLGCTRLELGIQSVYDDQLEAMKRGHLTKESKDAIKILKNLGFKLNYHYMIGLPNWSKERDMEGLKTLFSDPAYKPDMLKIYPCMVLKGTELYDDYEKGNFTPITTNEAAELIANFMPTIPEYCRVMRVQRDIPTKMTVSGVDKTNLRQYVDRVKTKDQDRSIRAREPSFVYRTKGLTPKNIEIFVREYDAADGKEFFISAEDVEQDILLGFCRLRFPSESLRDEIQMDTALIRELHVYGKQMSLGKEGSVQHKGFGRKLLAKAEEIAKENSYNKMVVISGIGVREYYRKFGYKTDGPYVSKKLN